LLIHSGHWLVTYRVRRIAEAKCTLASAVCVSVCLSLATFPHYCTDPDVSWGNGRWSPLVVHYWAVVQSVHAFSCYDNIAPNAKCQRVVVLALCLFVCFILSTWHAALGSTVRYCRQMRCGIIRPQQRGLSVCLSVCRSVTITSLAKRLNRSRCRFGICSRVGPSRKHVLDEVQIPHEKGQF